MKHTPHQPLSERFARITSMMLGILRAQGWRALLHLPSIWLAMRMIRELGEALGALAAAFEAGTLPPIPTPQDQPAPLPYAAIPTAPPPARAPRRPPRRAAQIQTRRPPDPRPPSRAPSGIRAPPPHPDPAPPHPRY